MRKKTLILILTFIFAILVCSAASAADSEYIHVKVGEDQVLTTMNYHNTSTLKDTHIKYKSVVSSGNSAKVNFSTGAGTQDYAYARASTGVKIKWDGNNWDAKDIPVRFTFNFDYNIFAETDDLEAMDDIQINIRVYDHEKYIYEASLKEGYYKPFDEKDGNLVDSPFKFSISESNHKYSFITHINDEYEVFDIPVFCDLYGGFLYYNGEKTQSSASVSVKINSIKIEFLSKPNVKPTNSPDLVVNSIKVPTNHLFVNDVVGLKISASNKGNATADSSVIKLYLKQNKSNAPMIPLGVSINVPSLKTKESEEFITKIKIPATYKINNKNQVLESGEYKLIARADAANNIKESNEANDYSTSISIGRKIALVCGITEYPKGSGDNITGASSAKNFANFLMSTLKFSNIKLIRDKDVTPENIEYYIQKSNIKPQDIFLFYFAGHGADDIVRDSDGDEILNNGKTIPNDNKGMIVLNKDGKVTNVNYSTLKNCLDQKKSWKTIVILDCCYSGDFIEEVNNKDQYITMTASRGDLTTQQIQGYKELQFTHYFMESFNNKAIFYNINPKERVRIVPREITDKNKDKMITTKEAFNYTQQKIYSEPQLQEKTPIILYYY